LHSDCEFTLGAYCILKAAGHLIPSPAGWLGTSSVEMGFQI
jgi:hypothetical protein